MRETRLSGSEGGARFNPLSLPLSGVVGQRPTSLRSTMVRGLVATM
jgi:hypothetical protein